MTQAGTAPDRGGDADALRNKALEALAANRAGEAVRLLQQAAALKPRAGDLQALIGRAFWQKGAPEKAEKHFTEAERLAPRDPLVLNEYAGFLLAQLRFGEADALLRRAYALTREHPEILNNIGMLHLRQGRFADAEPFFAKASKLNPAWDAPFASLAIVLRDTKRLPLAEKAFRQALKLNPLNGDAWSEYGLLLILDQREEEAAASLRRAIELKPAADFPWFRLLGLLEGMGKLDEFAATLARAKAQFPGSLGLVTYEAKFLRRNKKEAEALALMQEGEKTVRPDAPKNHPFYYEFYYELGQLHDRANNAAAAFACFTKANDGMATTGQAKKVDRGYHTGIISELKQLLSAPEWKARLFAVPAPPEDRPSPVFLIGFPRSGTTLLDQILSSHPDIHVTEEKPASANIIKAIDAAYGAGAYPSKLPELDGAFISEMRKVFFAEHDGPGVAEKKILVDKLPLNILHVLLLQRVFPGAKFLLALRHPCDSVLSCYMQSFHLNNAMARFLDLGDSARFYDEAFSLWEDYRQALPLDMHSVRYEDVVADFRPAVEGVLGFLGVPWNDAVLAYDKTAQGRTRIRTPSYHQVTEKIYTRASGRWLRYRDQLAPILPILEPHARRHGYDMGEDTAPETLKAAE